MPHEKHTMPLLHYYLLLSSLTTLVFTAIATLVFLLLSPQTTFDTSIFVIILGFLLVKSAIGAYVVHSFQKQGRFNKASGTRFIGLYYGRVYGVVIGALIGANIAQLIGALIAQLVGFIIGGVLFYFAGRWIGSKTSNLIGQLLDHNLPVAEVSDKVPAWHPPSRSDLIALYAVVFPILLVLVAIYIWATDITFEGFPAGWLPVARWVVIAISLYSLAAPWLIKRRMSKNAKPIPFIDMFWVELGLSLVPVSYGFFLFILGASIVELGIYAMVSSGAAIYWSIKAHAENKTV